MRKYTVVLLCFSAIKLEAQFVNGQAARAALGQTTFTQGNYNPSQQILGGVSGLAYANGRLYVADSNRVAACPQNHRIVVFDTTQIPALHTDLTTDPNLTNASCYLCGFNAINSLGQPSFTPSSSNTGTCGSQFPTAVPLFNPGTSNDPTQPQMNNPTAVATDGNILAVADTDNNRVLIWNSIPTSMDQAANVVLGQSNFTSNTTPSTPNASSLRGPQGVWIQSGKMYVADTQNYRILIWNSIPKQNNQPADVVLGQSNFTTGTQTACDPTKSSYTSAANELCNPVSVTSDGSHVFVADLGFNRILIWNSIPTQNGQNADVVVGQPDMANAAANNSGGKLPSGATLCPSNGTDSSGNPTYPTECNTTLNFPRYALSDGTRLFIADGGNDRVLIFNSIPTANGAGADIVLGEPDFASDVVSSASISIASTAIDNTGAVDLTPSPQSLAYDGTNLYVSDPYNRRVLVFTPGDKVLPSNSIVNWASEIVRQEGNVNLTVTNVVANDTVTITIAGTGYTYTVKAKDTVDTIAQGLISLINASDPNVTASYAGTLTGVIYLSSKGVNLGYDTISLSASASNTTDITVTASGSYLSAGTAATASPLMLVEINSGTAILSDNTATANLSGTIPNSLGGVQVFMDGYATPVYKVSPVQVVAQVPYFFSDRNSTSVYVRTVHNDGSVSVTNAEPVYIAPANPGIFNAPVYPGQNRPWPASQAFHQSGNATAVVSIDGSVKAGDTATITIAGTAYTYTVVSSDTLGSIADNLIKLINASDPNVTASRGPAFDRVVLTAKQSGTAGSGISVAGSSSSGADVTVTAYTSSTCCAVTPGSLITASNPAGAGELITVNTVGLGLIQDSSGNIIQSGIATGQQYSGTTPNTAFNSVSATMGGSTAQVVSGGLASGSYGIYQVQLIVPSSLSANTTTPLYVAQNAFISNTVTVPVGTPVIVPNAPTSTTPPSTSPIHVDIDTPNSSSSSLSGVTATGGWAVDDNAAISSVQIRIDGVPFDVAQYGGNRPDACGIFPNRAGCPNVGWNYALDTTRLANGSHSFQITAYGADGLSYTAATAITVSNNLSANPTHVFIDTPISGTTYRGALYFSGWAVNDSAAISSVSVAIDGLTRGAATYGTSRPDVCNVYPNRAGCPDVGWQYFIDLGTLGNGTHTVTLTATAANGQSGIVANTFSVANYAASSSITINIDVPSSSTATLSGATAIGGWVADSYSAINSVTIAVDNIVLGNANYGGSRSDVCDVFTTAVGCPNVGWNATIDTTLLGDGAHTLQITANPAFGQSYTVTQSFHVANQSTSANPVTVGIDTPNSGNGSFSGTAAFSGWAISSAAVISSVAISVDGVSYGTASYGDSRPDVCAQFANQPGCPNVGWHFSLNTVPLANGTHILEVTATNANGGRATGSVSFTVANSTSGPNHLYIDQPAANSNPFNGLATFSGWALNDNATVASISVTMDGVPYGTATYGSSRPDVCASYPGRPGCPNVGWTFSFDTTRLPDGTHLFAITETANDGTFSTASQSFTISNYVNYNPMHIVSDTPNSSSTPFYGTVSFGGWALDDRGTIASVQIAIDGVLLGNAAYGGSRSDVCSVFSGRSNCPNVGWNFTVETTLFPNGAHTLAITATTTAGQSSTATQTFITAN